MTGAIPSSIRGIAALIGILVTIPCASADSGAREPFAIAITVDDLPAHGALPTGMTRLGIAEAHIAAFHAHRVAKPFGFVNASKIGTDPDSEAVLAAWRAAGYPLGNHTDTHLNLDRAPSLSAWEADVIAGESMVERYMKGADWHYLRFPNLAAGSDPARHRAAAAFLRGRGYRIADVSIAFSDWSYTDAYARCLAKRDTAAIKRMKVRYLDGVDSEIVRMRAISRRVYGRIIPQVLLTHIGGWSAIMLPDVLARLDAAGARYVTLPAAQRDPAYTEAVRLPSGGSLMERTARARKVDLTDIARPAGLSDLKDLCR